MTPRLFAISVCLSVVGLLHGQQERRIRPAQQPVRASDPEVLKAVGIDPSQMDAAQFRILSQLSEAGLREALDGADPATIMALNGQTLDRVIFAAVGDVDQQLVYRPLTPCRLIDTRTVGGVFTAPETRNYDLIGPTNYSMYGGKAGDCGIPSAYIPTGLNLRGNRVRALILNLTSVTPTGIGFLLAWPTNQTAPNASTLNYGNDFALANSVTARTCDASCNFLVNPACNPCPLGDLSIRNASGTTHVLVDVVGYMEPAELAQGSEGAFDFRNMPNSNCTTLASCVATNNSAFPKGVTVIAHASAGLEHTGGTKSEFTMGIDTTAANCSGFVFANSGQSKFQVPASTATNPYIEGTASSSRRYTIAPFTSVTYYVNGQMTSGASAGDFVDGTSIQCIVNQ